jgi:hypothetical protein
LSVCSFSTIFSKGFFTLDIFTLRIFMSITKKPGETTGKDGGIFQEIGPRGGKKDNWTTIPDHKTAPPTSKPGHEWQQVKKTPDSHR